MARLLGRSAEQGDGGRKREKEGGGEILLIWRFIVVGSVVILNIKIVQGNLAREMITWAQLGLQDAASPIMEEYMFFHDFTMVVLVFIIRFVGYIICRALARPYINTGLLEGQAVECVWTLLPAVVLAQVAVPSLLLLYALDEGVKSGLTLKVVGHQWYWSYEYSDFWGPRSGRVEFDAYMLRAEEAAPQRPRLLEADNHRPLPWGVHRRVLVRSADVLHSWAVPALGVKADACPGRLNQVRFVGHRPGVLYGQCSEICGANHRFIPITIEFVAPGDFLNWVGANL